MVACILYNLSFVVLVFFDLCGCCQSNNQNVREIRRDYYYQKIMKHEGSIQSEVPEEMLDLWVARGDLNEEWIDKAGE